MAEDAKVQLQHTAASLLRKDKRNHATSLAKSVSDDLDENQMKDAFHAIKLLRTGSRKSKIAWQRTLPTLKDQDGQLLPSVERRQQRWLQFSDIEAGQPVH